MWYKVNMTKVVAAYWPERAENKTECALRISTALHGLAGASERFDTWNIVGKPRSPSLSASEITSAKVKDFLFTNKRDSDNSEIEQLGVSLNLWNKHKASVAMTCGSYSKFVRNCFVVTFECDSEDELQALENKIFELAVSAFGAKYGAHGVASTFKVNHNEAIQRIRDSFYVLP